MVEFTVNKAAYNNMSDADKDQEHLIIEIYLRKKIEVKFGGLTRISAKEEYGNFYEKSPVKTLRQAVEMFKGNIKKIVVTDGQIKETNSNNIADAHDELEAAGYCW